jgi:hypothetical protein
VPRLVWELEHNVVVPDGLVVRHTCDNPLCCRPDHLLVGTQADNVHDREERVRGVRVHGEAHHKAVLNEDLVRAIRRLVAAGAKRSELRSLLGVSYRTIHDVVRGRTWRQVT